MVMAVHLHGQIQERIGSRKGFAVSPFESRTEGGRRQGSEDPQHEVENGGDSVVQARFLPSPSLNGQLRER